MEVYQQVCCQRSLVTHNISYNYRQLQYLENNKMNGTFKTIWVYLNLFAQVI